ncbi:hypothetical protein PSHT_06809 [Puccinia striiformis]|uniref:Uncharacterized protein n=1 Tax=Puccinia striiformis TaxID=27350 RepID=A0A2S4W345_9BASI|nr:hypothetical protein PSHT_06809 [Puccinia striiformis]
MMEEVVYFRTSFDHPDSRREDPGKYKQDDLQDTIQIVFEVFTLLVVGMSDRKQPIYRDPWAKREAWRKDKEHVSRIRNSFDRLLRLRGMGQLIFTQLFNYPRSKKHSEDQIKQKDNLLGWVTGQDDKKADHK